MKHALLRESTRIHRIVKTVQDVGLGYITLGQPATTLSEERPNESNWRPSSTDPKEAHILHLG